MKKYVFFLLGILLISGCEKEANENSQGYPGFHFVYFELFDVEGKQFGNNEIEISHKMIMNNSKLEPFYPVEEQWFKMGLLELEDNHNTQLFGFSKTNNDHYEPILFESSERWDFIKKGLDDPIRDWYYLFRNADDHTKIDTLRIHDVINVETSTRTYDFFINEKPLELHGDGEFKEENPNYITLQLK